MGALSHTDRSRACPGDACHGVRACALQLLVSPPYTSDPSASGLLARGGRKGDPSFIWVDTHSRGEGGRSLVRLGGHSLARGGREDPWFIWVDTHSRGEGGRSLVHLAGHSLARHAVGAVTVHCLPKHEYVVVLPICAQRRCIRTSWGRQFADTAKNGYSTVRGTRHCHPLLAPTGALAERFLALRN